MENSKREYPRSWILRKVIWIILILAVCIALLCFDHYDKTKQAEGSPLNLPSVYGDTQAFHPSVLFFEKPWNGYQFWMAYSPYPQADDSKENPHIMASNDGVNWELPDGFSNPLDGKPDDYEFHVCYNSDPELVYNNDTDEIECWWRLVDDHNDRMVLYRRRTSNGVVWTEKENMLETIRSKNDYVSPTLLYENGVYRMWAVGDGYKIKYNEWTPETGWAEVQYAQLKYTSDSIRSWHIAIKHTQKGYEMILVSFNKKADTYPRGCMPLYYAISEDGMDFGTATMFFEPINREDIWFNQGLYRSSFAMVGDKYYVYFSGIRKTEQRGVGLLIGDDIFNLKLH